MSAATVTRLVAHCRSLLERHAQEADAELLARFAQQRDAGAFEQLVERYAALVWGVCRRILPCEADCEDAFQATFLALVRQAGSLDPNRPLGGWLHTVAVRVARKAQARALRQRPQAVPPERPTPGDIADDISSRELLSAVDEEIARLPAVLRVPLVLCCLEGRTRDEAAEAIGCSLAAIKSRLARARSRLRRQLARRGIGLPAAFLVLGLTARQAPAALRVKAVQCAMGSVPPAIAALVTAGATPLVGKLVLTALCLVAAGVLGLGAWRFAEAGPPKDSATGTTSAPVETPPARAASDPKPAQDRYGDPLPPGAVQRFGTLRFRHSEIADLAFTPDGKELLAGSGRTTLAVFDPVSGRRLREVGKVSINNVYGFALSSDGKRVACCGFDVGLWDVQTGKLLRELGSARCQAVAFSPDGSKVAAVREWSGEFQVFEAATGKRLKDWSVSKADQPVSIVRKVAFSRDGQFVAGLVTEMREDAPAQLTARTTQVRLWDAVKGTPARTFGPGGDVVRAYAFWPGTGQLATLSKDGAVQFWDVATGKELRRIPSTNKAGTGSELASDLRFSEDGRRYLVNQQDGTLGIFNAQDGKEVRRIQVGPTAWFSPAALSPDGRTVAFAKLWGEACVRVWDVETGAERLADAGHRSAATIALSADGRSLISHGDGGRVFHWDLRTGNARVAPADAQDEMGRPSRNRMVLEVRGARWQLKVNLETMKLEVRSLDGAKLLRKVDVPTTQRGFALSPDGSHLAVSFQDRAHTVWLWNPEQEAEPRKLQGHPDACQQLLFTHDGKRLIAGAGTHNAYQTETLWVWDVTTAQLIRKLASRSAPGSMLLTADDRVLICGGLWNDATVHAWDLETGKALATLAHPGLKETSED
jgi:RNA polymerase sigma factor (sigma-70 family)